MNSKLRQMTDSIHGTIYLSELESKLMATAFFNRLNDVYQSSTVYLTFPSNRTKRFEHSLGTMDVASRMFCAAIQNAASEDRKKMFSGLSKTFDKLLQHLGARDKFSKTFYATTSAEVLNELIPGTTIADKNAVLDAIGEVMKSGGINDPALDHIAVGYNNFVLVDAPSTQGDISRHAFIYRCVLEALRIAALFHDAGHPPYSHIVEEVLTDILKEMLEAKPGTYNKTREKEFVESLKNYTAKSSLPKLLLDNKKARRSDALHENIGIRFLASAFKSVLKDVFEDINAIPKAPTSNMVKALYHITVVEFAFAILLEVTPELTAIHRIIAGAIDADRMDYITRDSRNSGVNWGEIPYKRIVESAKLVVLDGKFRIAFPHKLSDDLDDLIVARYKIFNRINFHHRSVKTAKLLQCAIRQLVVDYLKKSDNKTTICPEISELWMSLTDVLGSDASALQTTQWNDSWLMSVFKTALIKLSDSGQRATVAVPDITTPEEIEYTLNLLEEVLLNKKYYHSMIKRRRDAIELMDMIRISADLDVAIEKIRIKENNKLAGKSNVDNALVLIESVKSRLLCDAEDASFPTDGLADDLNIAIQMIRAIEDKRTASNPDALDALIRIRLIEDSLLSADFERLGEVFAFRCIDLITEVLDKGKSDGKILDHMVEVNDAREKYGINSVTADGFSDDIIYFYDTTSSEISVYEEELSLVGQLYSLRNAYPWLFVYIKPKKDSDVAAVMGEFKRLIAEKIGETIKARLKDVFGYLPEQEVAEATPSV